MTDEPDIDRLWQAVQKKVQLLQNAGRLPHEGAMYEPGLDVVRESLRSDQTVGLAEQEATNVARSNKAAGYSAFELLKEYELAYGTLEQAARHAATAAKLLIEAEKAHQKRLKRHR